MKIGTWCLALALGLVAPLGLVRADDKDLDAKIDASVYATINKGVALYNGGNPAACYYLYEGALTSLEPVLAYRPELQQAVTNALRPVAGSEAQKAFALREVLDRILNTVRGGSKSLWDRLGGEPAVKAVVHDFVLAAATDPKVDFTRGGKYKPTPEFVANLERLLVEQISSVSGGPYKYTGRDMKSSHAGMGITDAQFGAIAGDLVATLKKYKVAQKEIDELVGIIATTKADIVSGDAPPPPPAPPVPSPNTPPTPSPSVPPVAKTLWDRLGGEDAVKAVVHDFVIAAATNPKVDFTRGGRYQATPEFVQNLERLLVEQISSVSGGPFKYTGRDMKTSHAGMKITAEQFGAIAGDLVATLKKYKVAQKEIDELVGIIATTKGDIVEDGVPPPPPTPKPAAMPPKAATTTTEAVPPAPKPAATSLPPGAVPPADKALWDRLGGEKAVRAVVHDFVGKTAANPKVDFTRGGKYKIDAEGVKKLEQLLVELISTVSGGPLNYSGRDMKASHMGMAITDDQFNAMAGDLIAVLKQYKVPQAEIDELVGIIAGTRDDIVEKK